jgi:protein-S-isoprenylcysteine O-methyltransferase Ste14
LVALQEDPELQESVRKRAIKRAVIALAEFHRLGFTHGDAMADNVVVDLEAGVAHWFDFETIHDSRRPMTWRRADDVRALIVTCLIRTVPEKRAETLYVGTLPQNWDKNLHHAKERLSTASGILVPAWCLIWIRSTGRRLFKDCSGPSSLSSSSSGRPARSTTGKGGCSWGIFVASTVGYTVYLAIYDRRLLERRLKAGPQHEREWSQKIIVSLVLLAFFGLIVVSALDYRYAWSPVAPEVSILGDVVILLSFLFIFWVIRVNSFAASNIRVEKDQSVIDTGPYAHVRHPMYPGTIWLFVGMPLALGSWWSLVLILPFVPVLLWRLLDEEKILQRDLPGYTEYMRRVRSRLVPFVW